MHRRIQCASEATTKFNELWTIQLPLGITSYFTCAPLNPLPFHIAHTTENVKSYHCAGSAMTIIQASNVKHCNGFNCHRHFYSIISMLWHRCAFCCYFIGMRSRRKWVLALMLVWNRRLMKYWTWNRIARNGKIHGFGNNMLKMPYNRCAKSISTVNLRQWMLHGY